MSKPLTGHDIIQLLHDIHTGQHVPAFNVPPVPDRFDFRCSHTALIDCPACNASGRYGRRWWQIVDSWDVWEWGCSVGVVEGIN